MRLKYVYSHKIPGVLITFLLLAVLVFSCSKKDKSNCYICTTTYTTTTDVPVTGYPMILTDEKELCDITPEEIKEYERTYTVTETPVNVGGIIYYGYKTTTCVPE